MATSLRLHNLSCFIYISWFSLNINDLNYDYNILVIKARNIRLPSKKKTDAFKKIDKHINHCFACCWSNPKKAKPALIFGKFYRFQTKSQNLYFFLPALQAGLPLKKTAIFLCLKKTKLHKFQQHKTR